MVFLMPALFLVMFLGVQGALYYHAREVALAAAQEGAREAGSENGSRESGVATANGFLRDAGGSDVMPSNSIHGSRTTTTAPNTVRPAAPRGGKRGARSRDTPGRPTQ